MIFNEMSMYGIIIVYNNYTLILKKKDPAILFGKVFGFKLITGQMVNAPFL